MGLSCTLSVGPRPTTLSPRLRNVTFPPGAMEGGLSATKKGRGEGQSFQRMIEHALERPQPRDGRQIRPPMLPTGTNWIHHINMD